MSDSARGASVLPRRGIGALTGVGEATGLFVAFEMAAFITRANVGLIPHARHGARGVLSFAVCGSKFEGTGLE